MQAQVTNQTPLAITAKGQRHNPRPSAMANHLSWGAVQATLAKGPATVAQLVEAIQAANPQNQGNAPGYVRYMLRNGHLTTNAGTTAPSKATTPQKAK